MHYKGKIGISIVVILAILGISLAREYRFDAVGEIILMFSTALIAVLFVLLFLNQEVFTAWFKFMRVFVPIAIVLMVVETFFFNESNSLGMTGSGSLAFILITTYVIASIVLIVRAHRRLKRGTKNANPFTTGGQKPT